MLIIEDINHWRWWSLEMETIEIVIVEDGDHKTDWSSWTYVFAKDILIHMFEDFSQQPLYLIFKMLLKNIIKWVSNQTHNSKLITCDHDSNDVNKNDNDDDYSNKEDGDNGGGHLNTCFS